MQLIRASTLTVSDLNYSTSIYSKWLDYSVIEDGTIDESLAASWNAPNTAGLKYAILGPASKADVYIRLIEQPPQSDYRALRSYGWSAIEICNQDTQVVNRRMESAPFEIIGSPKLLDGMPAIYPMQVKGPDEEIIYLTEIRADMEEYDLPRAESLIDKLFILVLACRDIDRTGQWYEKHLLVTKGRSLEITYTMINQAFDLPENTKHALATVKHERDIFLEIDQYPLETIDRISHPGMLPPCAAISSFIHPDFDALDAINKSFWITRPEIRSGAIYKGKRAATLRDPDGALVEIIEA